MTESGRRINVPAWVDLSSTDAAASRAFYGGLFGWSVEVNPDPQYGGYAIARLGDTDVAGIGDQMQPGAPSAWMVYIGTADAAALGEQVQAAGGQVVAPAFDIGDQGRMAVFQDPAGAFISAWQPAGMGSFLTNRPNAFAWAELNSRDVERALPFYASVFGWSDKRSPMPDGSEYVEFQKDGDSIAGGQAMNPMVPAEVPSYWGVYFGVEDVDATYQRAIAGGAQEMLPPMDFPGGRFAILGDPQGASFGIMKMEQ